MRPVRWVANFINEYLSPGDRLAETLCGLIMVLTFTLAAAPQLGEGREGVRNLLVATVGCNLAWGIIDGALYAMSALIQRGRRARLARRIQKAGTEEEALGEIGRELDDNLEAVASAEDRRRLYSAVRDFVSRAEAPKTRLKKADVLGALAIFLVEVLCTLPAAVPFLIFRDDPYLGLRVSNGILLLLLFAVGWKWASAANAHKFFTGLLLLLIGGLLVAVALALGG
jgi:VIT1/CCC1 family predicted Fe2+/Mn2+ transporter